MMRFPKTTFEDSQQIRGGETGRGREEQEKEGQGLWQGSREGQNSAPICKQKHNSLNYGRIKLITGIGIMGGGVADTNR